MKAIIQGSVLIVLFLATLLVAQQINWMSLLNVEETKTDTEEKVGELIWETFIQDQDEIKTHNIIVLLDSVVTQLCMANAIDRDKIKLHLVEMDRVNAFALPGDHLVVYSGLITATDDPDELAGVLSHELAHIELDHVMQKLIKEIGLATLISMAGGNSGGQIIRETVQLLSSSAFDRIIEKEADIQAVEYLVSAKIDAEPLANFLYKISENSSEYADYVSWISTHPDSKERAEYILEYAQTFKYEMKPSLTSESWNSLQISLEEL